MDRRDDGHSASHDGERPPPRDETAADETVAPGEETTSRGESRVADDSRVDGDSRVGDGREKPGVTDEALLGIGGDDVPAYEQEPLEPGTPSLENVFFVLLGALGTVALLVATVAPL
jgi:hypothetical protein